MGHVFIRHLATKQWKQEAASEKGFVTGKNGACNKALNVLSSLTYLNFYLELTLCV